jgi:hypothetical protein
MFSIMISMMSYTVVSNYDSHARTVSATDKQVVSNYQELSVDDLLRAELTAAIYNDNSTSLAFIKTMNCYFYPTPSCPKPELEDWQKQLVTQTFVKGVPNHYITRELISVSPNSAVNQYADYRVISKDPAHDKIDTDTIRLSLGQAVRFNNAITMNSADCLFCHATIYGNVAQYNPIGMFPDGGTKVHGGYYTASWIGAPGWTMSATSDTNLLTTAADQSDASSRITDYLGPAPNSSNDAATMSYAKSILSGYQGMSLPWNIPRQKLMLPKFSPDSALLISHGSLSGPPMQLFPFGNGASGSLNGAGQSACQGTTRTIQSLTDCNVVINARDNEPLVVTGNVFIRGDVIIFGKVTGQGAIYSGRNIYVADNITYVNPAPQFDGSADSNAVMHDVSNNAASLANQMLNYDELKLFAANNLVIGDPYPEYEGGIIGQGIAGTDLNYMFENIFSGTNSVARDPMTGYILDATNTNKKGTPCYVYPWSAPTQCVKNPVIDVWQHFSPYSDVSNQDYWKDQQGLPLPEAYTNNFYPKNPIGKTGALHDWISPEQFIAITKNPDAWAHASALDTYGRRKRQKMFTFPVILKNDQSDPYNPNDWQNGQGMIAAMQGYMGADLSKYEALRHGNRAAGDNSNIKLDVRVAAFIDQCFGKINSTGGYGRFGTWANGRCVFSYNSVTQVSSAFVENFCSDMEDSGGGSYTGLCTTDGSDTPPAVVTRSQFYAGDFSIHILSGVRSQFPRIKIVSPYWDPGVVRPRNRIAQIQSYLFANQFISYADDSISDRQLKVSGGMLAKDIAGRFVNHFGTDRTYFDGLGPTTSQYSLNEGASPSLIVYQDPRFQFDTELLSFDFGSTVFHF